MLSLPAKETLEETIKELMNRLYGRRAVPRSARSSPTASS
jgi:hypothetical protein